MRTIHCFCYTTFFWILAIGAYAWAHNATVTIPYTSQAEAAQDQIAYAQDIFNAADHPAKKRGR